MRLLLDEFFSGTLKSVELKFMLPIAKSTAKAPLIAQSTVVKEENTKRSA